ncbi:MAG: asparaginase [Acidimicrobiales bacterium]
MVDAAPVTVIIATGGTIASRPGDAGVVSSLSGEELASAVPGLADEGPIEVQDLMNVNAFRIQALEILEIARAARSAAARPDVGGVVVTHGTDTMEESAYLTDLLFGGDEPIVFTGAQRHARSPGADGPANLLGAVRLARAPAARGLGAVIAFEGRVDAARAATKVHTYALRAFGAPQGGPLGELGPEGEFRLRYRPVRPANLVGADAIESKVALVKLAAGIDGSFVDAAVERGYRAIVIEGFGLGNANDAVLASVTGAVEAGVTVVVTSRCPAGSVAPVYGQGGGYDLAQAGAIFGGDLSGPKARILLMAALPQARSPGDIARLVAPHLDSRSLERGGNNGR